MNADEIRTLGADRDTDAAVAEMVMGWKWDDHNPRQRLLCSSDGQIGAVIFDDGMADDDGVLQWLPPLPQFSTDIAAAWEVVEWMLEYAYGFGLDWLGPGEGFECHFGTESICCELTAPLAICRAALLAVMGDES